LEGNKSLSSGIRSNRNQSIQDSGSIRRRDLERRQAAFGNSRSSSRQCRYTRVDPGFFTSKRRCSFRHLRPIPHPILGTESFGKSSHSTSHNNRISKSHQHEQNLLSRYYCSTSRVNVSVPH